MEEQRGVRYHPTLLFMDPNDYKTLVVMTTDGNRPSASSTVCMLDYSLDCNKASTDENCEYPNWQKRSKSELPSADDLFLAPN